MSKFEDSDGEALLLDVIERVARAHADGHVTLMRFTTGWKVMLGTPELSQVARRELMAQPHFGSLREAVVWLTMGGGR